jgi:putative hydrolase of the HAD superfamily
MLDIDAVAFDLDGTLYPNRRFYLRLVPFILREHRLLMAMGKARDALRAAAHEGRFYDLQARFMAEVLKEDPEVVKEKTERLIYRGWEPLFRHVKLFDGVLDTLAAFKLAYLGVADGWDAVLCSETTGRLKPDPRPFRALADALGLPCGRILYVGNSVAYDVDGARGVGMKTALVSSYRRKKGSADFVFSDYRQLRRFVLT